MPIACAASGWTPASVPVRIVDRNAFSDDVRVPSTSEAIADAPSGS